MGLNIRSCVENVLGSNFELHAFWLKLMAESQIGEESTTGAKSIVRIGK